MPLLYGFPRRTPGLNFLGKEGGDRDASELCEGLRGSSASTKPQLSLSKPPELGFEVLAPPQTSDHLICMPHHQTPARVIAHVAFLVGGLECQGGAPVTCLWPSAFTDLQLFVKADDGPLKRLPFLFQLCPALVHCVHSAAEFLGVAYS